ncbi:prolipoprotein diacylglyceryl transferase [Desulfococcaceae bacterium HSG9]|nr:prolipoprotein diacylglyceryl transferase [Desulfococcaceae bacterium HSG9]
MYPTLINLGMFSIHTYGLFIAIGFLAAMFLARREALRVSLDPEKITDLAFYILIAAIVGSRLFYVFTAPEAFLENPLEIFKIWKGGLVFFGGFIAALATALICMKKYSLPIWLTCDLLVPSLALGHFFGRMGCFFAGCCYGKQCDLPWAVTFSHPESLAPTGVLLHPTQLYSSMSNLIIFSILWFWRRRKTFDGQVFWIYILLYGIMRSLIEQLRDDFRGATVFDLLSLSQTIGLFLAIIALIMLIFSKKSTESN